MRRLLGMLLLILFSVAAHSNHAETNTRILVLYPQINDTYKQIFTRIIDGVRTYPDTQVFTLSLSRHSEAKDIRAFIRENRIDGVIALGQSSYEMGRAISKQIPVIHGGLLMQPDDHTGISLVAAPEQFFMRLNTLAPEVKRVFTIYNEENSGWLIRLARDEARKHNIELVAIKVDNIREAVSEFRKMLDTSAGPEDAVWLLLDKVLPDKTVLPLALATAWEKGIVLFSNNPSHTRRGALFSLFPDHMKMGFDLARLSHKQLSGKLPPTVFPLDAVKISVNERTASHLGLRYSRRQRDDFDIVYPRP